MKPGIQFIKQPILSEKAYAQMQKGAYTFLVDTRARKNDIAKQIAWQFSVKVKKINIVKKLAKAMQGKKAVVWLAANESIPALLPKTKKQKK